MQYQRTISISIAIPGLSDKSILISSPLTLLAGVQGFAIFIGSLGGKKAKVLSFSSSLGVSSRCDSSLPASSGYRPRSDTARGVRGWMGSSEHDDISRWNAASDFTSFSSGRDS